MASDLNRTEGSSCSGIQKLSIMIREKAKEMTASQCHATWSLHHFGPPFFLIYIFLLYKRLLIIKIIFNYCFISHRLSSIYRSAIVFDISSQFLCSGHEKQRKRLIVVPWRRRQQQYVVACDTNTKGQLSSLLMTSSLSCIDCIHHITCISCCAPTASSLSSVIVWSPTC